MLLNRSGNLPCEHHRRYLVHVLIVQRMPAALPHLVLGVGHMLVQEDRVRRAHQVVLCPSASSPHPSIRTITGNHLDARDALVNPTQLVSRHMMGERSGHLGKRAM